jgi:NADPH:quinone reductase-like Zn-dependent oxidoreductase
MAKKHEMATSVVDQTKEDQTHSSMMAWRVHEFGPPNVMRFEQVLRPTPGPSEVLVKVEAAGVGPWDGWIRAGKSALPQPLLSVPKLHSLTTISVLALSVDRIGIDQHTAEPYAGSYANRH